MEGLLFSLLEQLHVSKHPPDREKRKSMQDQQIC